MSEKIITPSCPECNMKCKIDDDGWYCPRCRTLSLLKEWDCTEEEIKDVMVGLKYEPTQS